MHDACPIRMQAAAQMAAVVADNREAREHVARVAELEQVLGIHIP